MQGSSQSLDDSSSVLESSRVDPYRSIVKLAQDEHLLQDDLNAQRSACLSFSPRQLGEPHQDETSHGGRSDFPVSLSSAAASMCQVSRRSREAIGPPAPCTRWIRRARKIQDPKTSTPRREQIADGASEGP
ncbi:hypothetical protein SVAN01_10544 [Stagonosporopsis vannaccii]|nr:hypothetical protein SVAN01_10544 [Stagonosporopsis vannaccii]